MLGKNKASTVVIIDEIDTDNYGLGGKTITEVRKRVKRVGMVGNHTPCHCEKIRRIFVAIQKNKINPHEVRILAPPRHTEATLSPKYPNLVNPMGESMSQE